ncbi:hypothetical protein CRENBAI_011890 [Crenichthys baileyi]|uniref:Uncharacterized protein n=1 Tax=Crenichthys baileyi TaxID=28760 RepID=A0AAV9SDJ9_9TELE
MKGGWFRGPGQVEFTYHSDGALPDFTEHIGQKIDSPGEVTENTYLSICYHQQPVGHFVFGENLLTLKSKGDKEGEDCRRSHQVSSVCSVVSVDPVGLAAATSGYWVSADNQASPQIQAYRVQLFGFPRLLSFLKGCLDKFWTWHTV